MSYPFPASDFELPLGAVEPRAKTPAIGGLVVVGFAGGGGSSEGLKWAGLDVDVAMNHDAYALAMHQANHPSTLHLCQDINAVHPLTVRPGERIRLGWFSPDCKHFSKAKGGKPVEKKIRDLAWVVVLWARLRRPDILMLENVEEFCDWGPLLANGLPDPKRKGEIFRRFVGELRRLGYVVEWRELVACDYGAPTSRKRLFMVARCDGEPISWPAPTHGAPDDADVIAGRKRAWRTAAEILDFTLPCPSIFLTKDEARAVGAIRPLADATLRRVTLGLQRYVLEAGRPFIVPITHSDRPGQVRAPHSIDEPGRTQTAANRGEHALAVPTLIQMGYGERSGQEPRVPGVEKPIGCQVAGGNKHAVVATYMAQNNGDNAGHPVEEPVSTLLTTGCHQAPVAVYMHAGYTGQIGRPATAPTATHCTRGTQHSVVAAHLANLRGSGPRPGRGAEAPTPTDTAGGNHLFEVRTTFLVKYYGSSDGQIQRTDEPMHTLTTKPRHGLVEVSMAEFGLTEEQRYSAWWVARLIDVYGHPDGLPKRRRGRGPGSLVRRTLIEAIDRDFRDRPSAVGRDGAIAVDIGMRMLTVRERFRAQGVGDDFVIDVEVDEKPITATQQGAACGNMVCPDVAKALAAANLRELQREAIAA